jgi:uncharacterized protein (DUF1810 family)
MTAADPFDLERFVTAQAPVFPAVLAELKAGQKRTHWMWFVFPAFNPVHSATALKATAALNCGRSLRLSLLGGTGSSNPLSSSGESAKKSIFPRS